MRVPRVKEIITARPEGMDYELYRKVRKEQQRRLKYRLRGFMVWPSKGIFGHDREGNVVPVENRGTLVGPVPKLEFSTQNK